MTVGATTRDESRMWDLTLVAYASSEYLDETAQTQGLILIDEISGHLH